LENLPKGEFVERPYTNYTGSSVVDQDDFKPEADMLFGFQGADPARDDYFTLLLMQNLADKWDSDFANGTFTLTKFAQEIAKSGGANYFNTFMLPFNKQSLFGIRINTSQTEHLVDIIPYVFKGYLLMNTGVGPGHLDRAKLRLKSCLYKSLSRNECLSDHIMRELRMGSNRFTFDDLSHKIDEVTVNDVQNAVVEYCTTVEPVGVAMGSTFSFPGYAWLRGWTYLYRF